MYSGLVKWPRLAAVWCIQLDAKMRLCKPHPECACAHQLTKLSDIDINRALKFALGQPEGDPSCDIAISIVTPIPLYSCHLARLDQWQGAIIALKHALESRRAAYKVPLQEVGVASLLARCSMRSEARSPRLYTTNLVKTRTFIVNCFPSTCRHLSPA